MKRKFTLDLMCLRLGIEADQHRAIELAHWFGFESVEAQPKALANLSALEQDALRDSLDAMGLVWGCVILPIEFKEDRQRFESDLKALPRLAAGMQRVGAKRLNTWIRPCHNELTYQRDILYVDLNDAPLGVEFNQQKITRRELPLATGIIDIKPFLNALVKIGYDGPLRAEPFNKVVDAMDDETACQAAIESLRKAISLIN